MYRCTLKSCNAYICNTSGRASSMDVLEGIYGEFVDIS